jgi:hypothetical protein
LLLEEGNLFLASHLLFGRIILQRPNAVEDKLRLTRSGCCCQCRCMFLHHARSFLGSSHAVPEDSLQSPDLGQLPGKRSRHCAAGVL